MRRAAVCFALATGALAGCEAPRPADAAANRAAQHDYRLLVTAYAIGPSRVIWIAPGVECTEPLIAPIQPVLLSTNPRHEVGDLEAMRDFNIQMVGLARGHGAAGCHVAPLKPGRSLTARDLGGSSVADAARAVSLRRTLRQPPKPEPLTVTPARPPSVSPQSQFG